MNTPPLAIAGGGIAGLAAALALGSHDVAIYERSPAFAEVGAGLQLGPNAVRALQKLGAWDAVESITSSPLAIQMRDGTTGKILKQLPLGQSFTSKYGSPYRVAHRADLHAALLEVVQSRSNIAINSNSPVADVEPTLNGVAFSIAGKRQHAPALIAADGVHSPTRQKLFPETQPIDSGSVFQRALFAAPTIANIDLNCVTLWMHTQCHVVHYPVGKQKKLNLVAVVPKHQTVAQAFKSAAPALQEILHCAEAHMSPWPGFCVKPLQSWVKGSCLLLGDAAHATLPYLAQGAAMALEDASCLAQVLPTTQSLRHAFTETARRRIVRTTRLQNELLAAGHTYHLQGLMRHARNAALQTMPTRFVTARLNWLYNG